MGGIAREAIRVPLLAKGEVEGDMACSNRGSEGTYWNGGEENEGNEGGGGGTGGGAGTFETDFGSVHGFVENGWEDHLAGLVVPDGSDTDLLPGNGHLPCREYRLYGLGDLGANAVSRNEGDGDQRHSRGQTTPLPLPPHCPGSHHRHAHAACHHLQLSVRKRGREKERKRGRSGVESLFLFFFLFFLLLFFFFILNLSSSLSVLSQSLPPSFCILHFLCSTSLRSPP